MAPSRASTWKKDLADPMASIFERKNAADQSAEKQERRTSHLERKIGQLTIGKEFREKSAGNWESIRAKGHDRTRQQEALNPQAGEQWHRRSSRAATGGSWADELIESGGLASGWGKAVLSLFRITTSRGRARPARAGTRVEWGLRSDGAGGRRDVRRRASTRAA